MEERAELCNALLLDQAFQLTAATEQHEEQGRERERKREREIEGGREREIEGERKKRAEIPPPPYSHILIRKERKVYNMLSYLALKHCIVSDPPPPPQKKKSRVNRWRG